jgi:O-antigen/teichoic acid export membrane protein
LITVPLYISWLGGEKYGLLLTGVAISNYLMFTDAGANWSSMLLIANANGRDDREEISSILRNSFFLACCSALIVALLLLFFLLFINFSKTGFLFKIHDEFPSLLIVIATSVMLNLGVSPFYNLLIGLQETYIASIYQGAGTLIGALFAISMASFQNSIALVFAGNVAGSCLAGFLAAIHTRRRHPWAFVNNKSIDYLQLRNQLRLGARSFSMQIGNVLWGTAPVLVISFVAGAKYVPLYSVPMTLISTPSNIISSFSANLQAGYGEAMGRGEIEWVQATLRRIIRMVFYLFGILACGFLILSIPTINIWTSNRLEPSLIMIINTLLITLSGIVLKTLRYGLTGINRHGRAASADLLCGILAIAFGVFGVYIFGFEWISVPMLFAIFLTNGWVIPIELNKALNNNNYWPDFEYWFTLFISCFAASIIGWVVFWLLGDSSILNIFISGCSMAVAYFVVGNVIMKDETQIIWHLIQKIFPK